MRYQFWISVLLFAALGASVAMADVVDQTMYQITFTGTNVPTAGSFTYDRDTATFTNFLVTWESFTFDLTSSANAPTLGLAGVPSCIGSLTGGAAVFGLLDGLCTPAPQGGSTGWGTFTFTNGGIPGAEFGFGSQGNISNPGIGIQILAEVIPANPIPPLGSGGWSIEPEVVPEPSLLIPVALLLCAFETRKRIAQGLRQATRTNR